MKNAISSNKPQRRTAEEASARAAIQSSFLEDENCEHLARHFWPKNADADIRGEFISSRASALKISALYDEPYSRFINQPTKVAKLLSHARWLKGAVRELECALKCSDDEIVNAQRNARRFCTGARFPCLARLCSFRDANDLRTKAMRELSMAKNCRVDVHKQFVNLRQVLQTARSEIASVRAEDVGVQFILHDRKCVEANGSDVRFCCSLIAEAPLSAQPPRKFVWTTEIWVEIEPFLSDDFPFLLRRMEAHRKAARPQFREAKQIFVAVVGRYSGKGASWEQLRKMFNESRFHILSLQELGLELPLRDIAGASQGSLPLY